MNYFHELKQAAYQNFVQLEEFEGQADVYFIWAILIILETNSSTSKKRAPPTSPIASFSFDQGLKGREARGSIISESGLPPLNRGSAALEMLEKPSAIECLDEALRLFQLAEERGGKNCSFNIAKCQFEKAQCLIDSYGNDSEFVPLSRKLYFESRKNDILDCLKEVK